MKAQSTQARYEKTLEPKSKITQLPLPLFPSREVAVSNLHLNGLRALNDKDLTKLPRREVARKLLAIFIMLLMIVYLVWEME